MGLDDSVTNAQYLTFKLDHELFAIDIAKVHEVLEFQSMTCVPGTPDFVRGVMNLRGNVVPVIDMRLRLGLSMTERSVDTCVVIAEVTVDGESTVLGALVDSVEEVIDLDAGHLAPPPAMAGRTSSKVIHGMGKRGEQFIMILDLDSTFTGEDLRASAAAAC
jgi:purine-binding chemotaxis protein CheW